MEYQVWTKDDYQAWVKKDCADMVAAQTDILTALKQGKEPLLTVSVPWGVEITIKEDKIGATTESQAESDKGSDVAGYGTVRRGNEENTPGLG